MVGIIDIHAHILPGIDDGARDWDECKRMLREAYNQGIRHITATPHYSRKGLPPALFALADRLSSEAREIDPNFKTGLGQETYFHQGLIENLRKGRALTLEGSRYVLVEFDPGVSKTSLYQAARLMVMAGYLPVIAHVERYFCLREEGHMDDLIRCGCMLQMNYSSLNGRRIWNREVHWCRRQVLDGRIHLLGTDMHRMDYRRPDLKESMEWLKKHIGDAKLNALIYGNGEKILRKEKRENRDIHGKDVC